MIKTKFTRLVKSSPMIVKLFIQSLNSFSNILQQASIGSVEIYITFGELQSIYVNPVGPKQSNILLLDVLINLSLETKLGYSLEIF